MKKDILQLNIKSTHYGINIFFNSIIKILLKLQIRYKCIHKPTLVKKITLLKSPHINKKAREQFEIKNYKKTILIYATRNVQFLKFFVLNKPKFLLLNIKRVI